MLPAASIARTWNECWPTARFVSVAGDVQAANAARSSEHWNVVPVSGDVNWNVAVVLVVVASGPLLMTVSGSVWSIVHVNTAGCGSTAPAPSTARTRKM